MLHRQGNALPHSDAHSRKCAFTTDFVQSMRGCEGEPCAAHAQRMSERDCSAVPIDVFRVLSDAKQPQTCDSLAGKRFVQLNPIKIGNGEIQSAQKFLSRRHGTDPHDAWRNTGGGHAQNARARFEAMPPDRAF